MHVARFRHRRSVWYLRAILILIAIAILELLVATRAHADAVTDWNEITVQASKGFNGVAGSGVSLDSAVASRLEAVEGRAVFDAANAIDRFSPGAYYYNGAGSGSPAAAVAQAAHDAILGILPDPAVDATADARWAQTRAWVDAQLGSYVAALALAEADDGPVTGRAAAQAAIAARRLDNATPVTGYGAGLTPTSNPGIGLWRQSNAAPVAVNPATGAPTGFDATGATIQGRPGADFNWRDVTPFSLTPRERVQIVAAIPAPMVVGSLEYQREVDFVRRRGQDSATLAARTADQTAMALYYRQDTEIFIFEAARVASAARHLSLDDNARLFALLGNALADARIVAFASKYEQKFWRPITVLNADASGAVSNGYVTWRPLSSTPSHPSNTSGHSSSAAAGFETLRAFFGDAIRPDGGAVTLTSLPWMAGTNGGTGSAATRTVSSFSQAQLECGASRLYLGVHWGFDNLQGQLAGLAVADHVLRSGDPAAAGVRVRPSHVSLRNITRTLLARPDLYGLYSAPATGFNDNDNDNAHEHDHCAGRNDDGRDFHH